MSQRASPEAADETQVHAFTKALLDDLHALEQMLGSDVFEVGNRRIGAEQEMFLVDRAMRPAAVALEVLDAAGDRRLTTELAQFNLEANATPQLFTGGCLSALHDELDELVGKARTAAATRDADVVLVGILPTLRQSDLSVDNMTPAPRYHSLNQAMRALRGGDFRVFIQGVDELQTTHDNVMMESCNTSFQIHMQVHPDEFAGLYNLSQVITAPVLAAATNSPVFLGRRLWRETRIALFERSVDARSEAHQHRGVQPRVTFGEDWVRDSVLEIFREQITRFRIVLPAAIDEDPRALLAAGQVPRLRALSAHNGTIYRWNRACYGITAGKPHLRIENRAIPAGPTVADEIANAALYFGCMAGLARDYGDVSRRMAFVDAKHNFLAAAQHGLQAQFTWLDGHTVAAPELLLEELLPAARSGLASAGVDHADVDRYLGVIEARVRGGQTGSRWVLDSLAAMGGEATLDIRERTVTAALLEHQKGGTPVHAWPLAELTTDDWRSSYRTVAQFMSTDLFTVHSGDLVDLAASVMDWRHVRYVPVEDDAGQLVGVVSHRSLVRLVAQGKVDRAEPVLVRDIMNREPVTVSPRTPTLQAMHIMREHRVGCLPVVDAGKLVGIITQTDLIAVAARLLEEHLEE